ncbi:chaperonin 10-like protein [Mycena crocata]|nr:chaperonin 10-like protein [Mycena crocata]
MSHLAVVVGPEKTFSVKSIGIPTHKPNEILVKNCAAAQNPADLKSFGYGLSKVGFVFGFDYAGVVEKVGNEIVKAKKGDRIAGWIQGSSLRAGHGSYAQYVLVDDKNFWRIPDGVSFEEAASYGMVYQTAAQGLYLSMKLPEPYTTPAQKGTPILVWGGASSVGTMVIQLAKLSGFTVFSTASVKNHAYLKSLGADYVLPYADLNTPAQIRRLTGNQLYLGYDCISEKGSTQAVIDAFGSEIPTEHKKRVVVIVPETGEEKGANSEGVELHVIMVLTLLGKELNILHMRVPASQRDYDFSIHSYELLEQLITEKKIQPQRLKVMGGLEKVAEGFEYMRSGKVSAEKIIYLPWETKVDV